MWLMERKEAAELFSLCIAKVRQNRLEEEAGWKTRERGGGPVLFLLVDSSSDSSGFSDSYGGPPSR